MDGSLGMGAKIVEQSWRQKRHTFFQMEAACLGSRNTTLRFSFIPKGEGEECRITRGFRWVEENLTAADGTPVRVSGLFVEGQVGGVMESLNEKAFPANGYVLIGN